MGIWKWMKNTKARRYIPVLVLVVFFTSGTLSSEPTLGFRVLPGYYIPLGDSLLQPGFGGALVVDFMPISAFGFFAQGEYVNVGLENVSAIPLFDGSLGIGYIKRMMDRLSLRADLMAGIYSVTRDTKAMSGLSAGARISAEYHVSPILSASVHGGYRYYAYVPEPFMNAVNVGLGLTVNLNELFRRKENVATEKISQDPVFPVLYSWYDDNDFAVLKITNNEETTITDINVSFFLEQYMGQPKLCMTIPSLAPGASFDIPLKAFFNESMLELTEKIDTEANVIVEYRNLGSSRKANLPVELPVYHRNAMSWDDDRKAAAFVSSKDPAAMWFSKYVSGIVRDRFRVGVNKNMQYAMGVFEALNAYGLNYVIDPTSAYADNAGSAAAIDFLQYPYQTLMYRGGDCDDLSILFCSLLEAIGIETAFVTIPGHIFMAFSSGMTETEARVNFYASEQLIYQDGIAWVPLEITLTKEGFSKAWRIGAKEWNDANARGGAKLYPMKESWKIYKPVSIPGAASRFNLPDEAKTARVFDASLNVYVEREIRPQIQKYEAAIARSDTPQNRNELGVLYGKYGMLEEAKAQFALAAEKGFVPAWTNLGNIAFMEKKYADGLKYYNYARSLNTNDSIALLGSARSYYELEDFRNSDALYSSLIQKNSSLGEQYAYLGSFFETQGRAWSLSDRLSTTTWSHLSEKVLVVAAVPEKPVIAPVVETVAVVEKAVVFEKAAPVEKTAAEPVAETTPAPIPETAIVSEKVTAEPVPETVSVPAVAVQPVKQKSGGLSSMLSVLEVSPATVAKAEPVPEAPPLLPPSLPTKEPVIVVPVVRETIQKPVPTDTKEPTPPKPVVPAEPTVALALAPAVVKKVEPVGEPIVVQTVVKKVEPIVELPVAENAEPVVEIAEAVEPKTEMEEAPVQITPLEIKKVYEEVAAAEVPAQAAPVETAFIDGSELTETTADKNSLVPIGAAILGGLSATAAAITMRFRAKRKNLTKRNKT